MASADPAVLLEQLKAVVENPKAFSDHAGDIIQLSRKAAVSLEGPFEAFQRLAYSALPLVSARIAQEHGIFKALTNDSSNKPKSAATLAQTTHVNPTTLDSLLDYMSTTSMVEEVSPGQYNATALTHMLLSPLFIDGITHFHDNCLPAFAALNQTLSSPTDPRTAFEIGQHSDTGLYEWLESHPIQAGAFHRFMEAQFASLPSWLSVVQFDSEFASSSTPQTPVFVDVGGGNGQQCAALYQKYPDLSGRIVLQDRSKVLEKAVTSERVERLAHDFFDEQPVKGARAYYFRQIFHNYDDESCLRILKAHVAAMDKQSVILVDEKVLPDVKPTGGQVEYTAGLSIAMLAMFKALERRESHWRKLFAEAGFEVRAIRQFTDFGDSIIVAAPK